MSTGKMPIVPVTITASFDEAVEALAKGGKVLYTGKTAKSAKSHFKPVFWSTGHFKRANTELSSLGYNVRADHPALRGFPTDDWADWQWYNLVEGGVKHGLASIPDFEPIVMPVPDLHYSTFMGMLFELKVGDGQLMVCGLNLSDQTKPEVCAMRASILSYMESQDFNPAFSIETGKFKEAFAPTKKNGIGAKRWRRRVRRGKLDWLRLRPIAANAIDKSVFCRCCSLKRFVA